MTRCVIYARYSSDNQREASLTDQERECREYAKHQGWDVVDVYSDAAISGGSDRRPGYQKLLNDARLGKFDVVLAEALDRLSRRLADTANLHDELTFLGIRLFAKDQGEITKMHTAIMGLVAEQYVTDLREKTKRGQRGRIHEGMTAGGLGYGYIVGGPGERSVDPDQAEVIQRIFREYASGVSPREIAKRLNSDGVPGPRGKTWKDTTIRGQRDRGTGVLNNSAYIGNLTYGRTEYKKDPRTGKRVARPQPEDKWIVTLVPDLRIIDDGLWQAVKARQAAVTREMPRDETGNPLNRVHRKTHVLSGLIRCGQCGGPMAITAKGRYGCSSYRSSRACTNSRTIPRVDVEERVLSGLKQRLFDTELVGEFLQEFEREVRRLRKDQISATRNQRRRIVEIEAQIERMVDTIAEGTGTAAMTWRIKALEIEQDELRSLLGDADQADTVVPITNIARVYKVRIERLVDGLTDSAIRQEAIEIIQSMIEQIIVTPVEGGFTIDLHGELGAILALVDGKQKLPDTKRAGSSLSVVAGVGFEPTTFRL